MEQLLKTAGIFGAAMTVDSNPHQIVENIVTFRRTAPSARLVMCMVGYDNDPRELWEIEEVCVWCKRLIDAGLYGAIASHMRSGSKLKFDHSIFFPVQCATQLGKTPKTNMLSDFDFLPSIQAMLGDNSVARRFKKHIKGEAKAVGAAQLLRLAYFHMAKQMKDYPVLNVEAMKAYNKVIDVYTDLGSALTPEEIAHIMDNKLTQPA